MDQENVVALQNFNDGVLENTVLTYLLHNQQRRATQWTLLNVSCAMHMAHKMVTYLQNCHYYSYKDGYGGNDVDSVS